MSPSVNPVTLWLLLGSLALASPRSARAASGVSYKYEDYRESGGRIAVQTQSALIQQELGTATVLKLGGTLDSLAGATPNGQPAPAGSAQVPLATMDEERKAWLADLSRQFLRVNVALGVAGSRESDYVSKGWSINTLTDFNQKNTTVLAGVAGTSDEVKVFHQAPYARKRTRDVVVGVTQLLDARTAVGLNLVWGRSSGFLSDPYKLVQKEVEIVPGITLPLTFPENRPDERDKWIALATLNRAYQAGQAALEARYRAYRDTFGTHAHTLDVAWFQRLGETWMLRPSLRLHNQSAADFYVYRLDGTSIQPVAGAPRPQGPFYSSDYRLSKLGSVTAGLKVAWNPVDRLHVDLAYEYYRMEGHDDVTPQSAYAKAGNLVAGLRVDW